MKKLIAFIIGLVLMIAMPLTAESVRFAVVGDTQADYLDKTPVNDKVFGEIVQLVLAADPPVQFVLQAGDLINGDFNTQNRIAELEHWRSVAQPWYDSDFLGLKVYPTPGNHDQVNPASFLETWQTAFPELPENGPANAKKMTYSFNIGQCHFAVVNTSSPRRLDRHAVDLEWLESDLASTTQPVKFIIGHEPAYPIKRHVATSLDARPQKRDAFWQLLAKYNVKAYFCGHEHIYDHWIKDGVHQIITGSGGAPSELHNYLLVDVDDDNNITVSVYDIEGNTLIEQYNLADTETVPSEDRISDINLFYEVVDSLPCSAFLIFLALPFYTSLCTITNGEKYKHE
jgi:hypothetical protein